MPISSCVDQLDVNHYPVSFPTHAAFQHVRDSQCLRDVAKIAHVNVAKLHHGRTTNDLQVLDRGEAGEDVILNAISEKRVLLVGAEVLKGQNGDAFFRNRLSASCMEWRALINEQRDDQEQRSNDDKIDFTSKFTLRGRVNIFSTDDPLGRQLIHP